MGKVREGVVIKHNMDKTAVVQTERAFAHPKYLKAIKVSKKYLVHDEKNAVKVGDVVKIVETKPISKRKFHKVLSVVGKTKLKLRDLPKKKEKETAKESKPEMES